MNDDMIIAIETSGRRGSVALAKGPRLLGEGEFATQVEHARELLPALDSLCRDHSLAPAEIRQCYVSIGPGSFTGLRVAATFARHLALATGARLCAVPTLDVIVENCLGLDAPPANVAVILDAKREQVFAALFRFADGAYCRLIDPQLIRPIDLLAGAPRPIAAIGEGITYHKEAVQAGGAEILDSSLWWPRAASVHKLGWQLAREGLFTSPQRLVPCYIRRPEAEELWEKREGLPANPPTRPEASAE
ncbi:MAG TPA: tRNA (adenosine(37)-N6)-threonylcarbamoyltransferase complex dimerization subunit type 1 TsaB [Phycisphaerae bacterium]|nr:tRNA (adenosine(37)-N6)-threonylcarbamoyltransferase complex dimerization subunit type 1 TsaB [Phycisphaerae bacterium]